MVERESGWYNERMDTKERFWAKVEKRGCWLWTGVKSAGYGMLTPRGKGSTMSAHVFAYEMLVGPVPDGLEIDHLCRNRACVNPEHLEPVTHKVNCRRGKMTPQERFKLKQPLPEPKPRGAFNAAKTHCPKGHPYDEENTYYRKGNKNLRECLTCKRAAQRRWKAQKRASETDRSKP